jgi:hypothetical protein
VFQSHHSDNLSKHSWNCYQCILHVTTTCSLRTESTFLWMREDNRGRKYPRKLRQCRLQFWIFWIFVFCFCESLFRYMARCLSYILSTVLPSFAPSLMFCWMSKHFLQGYKSVFFCSYLHSYTLCLRYRKVSNALCGGRMYWYF